MFRDTPIKQKLIRVILLTCAIILVLSGVSSMIFDLGSFRNTSIQQLTAIGKIISANSTAALAFDSREEATEILSALASDQSIKGAYLYDVNGELFSKYEVTDQVIDITGLEEIKGFHFQGTYLVGAQPVMQGERKLGTLYLASDLGAVMMNRLRSFGVRSIVIMLASLVLAFFISRWLQNQISKPILSLTKTATQISENKDYAVRAVKNGNDEIGLLTNAFNQMLTEIQDQNQTIVENEARLRAVLDSSLTAVILVDREGRIIEWNEMAETMFGWAKEDVLGKQLDAIIIPERHRRFYQRRFRQSLENGQSHNVSKLSESVVIRRDQTPFPVEYSINTIKANGTDVFCGFITDITERKQAEKRIKAQLSRLSLLSVITRAVGERQDLTSIFQVVIQNLEDHLPVDFACIGLVNDIHGKTIEINSIGHKSLKLLNGSFEEGLASVHIEENNLAKCLQGVLVYESDIQNSDLPFLSALALNGVKSLVVSPLTIENQTLGVLFSGRKTDGFTSTDTEFLHQLSEHVSLAAHQARLHTYLQRAYDDLRQTQQSIMQQERLRALGQMSSGIAHDINNAISPISLYTETLLENEQGLSDNARKYLGIIQQATEDVSLTVARMREFYRKREPQINLVEVDLNKLILQVLDLTRAKWSNIPQEKGIVIKTKTDLLDDLPAIMGIESELREALTNLVFNAVDAMPDGGTLTIRTRVFEKPFDPKISRSGKFITAEIMDTGIGMSEETKNKCLEPFYTTKGERGTGLGLAMVYGVIKRHNADIEIESEVGKGAIVKLLFDTPTAKGARTDTAGKVNMLAGRKKILIIDDDPLLVRSLSDTLQSDGHLVITANGGEEGIKTFRSIQPGNEKFDIVITDLGMPYTDGRKVAQLVKELSSETPVVLLTGWGQRIVEEGEIPPFVDRVLSKPPKLRDLREVIFDLTERDTFNLRDDGD